MHTSGQLRLSPQWGQRPDTTFSSRWTKMLPTKLQRSVGALLFCRASQKQTQWCHSIIVAIIANTRASGSATSLDRANRKLAILLQQKKRRISSRLKDFLRSCWRERCFTSQHLRSCCWADSLTVHHHRGVAPFMEQALQHPNLYRLKQCDWCKAACRSPRGLIGAPLCSRALGQTSVIYAIVKTFTPICPQSTAIFQATTDCSVPLSTPSPLSTFPIQ